MHVYVDTTQRRYAKRAPGSAWGGACGYNLSHDQLSSVDPWIVSRVHELSMELTLQVQEAFCPIYVMALCSCVNCEDCEVCNE